jgi:hypothetical protein
LGVIKIYSIILFTCLAALFIFQLTWHWMPSPDVVMVLAQFTSAFGYWVMPLWAVGFSFIYQSTQPTPPQHPPACN